MKEIPHAANGDEPSAIVNDPLYENPVTQEYKSLPHTLRQEEQPSRRTISPRQSIRSVKLRSVQSALLLLTMVLLLIDLFVPGTSPAEPFLYTAIIITSAAVSIVSIKLHQVATAVGYGFISLMNIVVLIVNLVVLH